MVSLPADIERRIEELRRDNITGATALAIESCKVVLALLAGVPPIPIQELQRLLEQLCRALAQAQPMMAPILNLANGILLRSKNDPAHMGEEVREFVVLFSNRLETSLSQLSLHALRLFDRHSVILTHSHSSAVEAALLNAHQSGKSFSVICTESLPMKEGAELSRELAHHGIQTTLVPDDAVFSALSGADCVMVGADAISLSGAVNKSGTRAIAEAAHRRGIPFYVLCGSAKFISQKLTAGVRRGPASIFDLTPVDHITLVITEDKSMTASEFKDTLLTLESTHILERPSTQHHREEPS